jgi:hypothetical protein
MDEQREVLTAEFPPALPSRMKQQRVAAFDDAMLGTVRQHVCAICSERVRQVEALTFDEIRDEHHFRQLLGRIIPPTLGARTVGMSFLALAGLHCKAVSENVLFIYVSAGIWNLL